MMDIAPAGTPHAPFLRRLFLLFWLGPVLFVNPAGDAMSEALLLTTVAVADRRSLEIDPRTTADVAVVDGRYYCGLGPGGWVIALPYYWALRGAFALLPDSLAGVRAPFLSLDPRRSNPTARRTASPEVYFLQIAMVWLLLAPLLALLGALSALYALQAGASAGQAAATGAVCAFGTLLFPYSCLYSKAALAALLTLCALLWRLTRGKEPSRAEALAAGLLMGASVATDYVSAPLVALAGPFYLRDCRPRQAACFAAGLLAVMLLLGALHAAMYGHPLRTGYDLRARQDLPARTLSYRGWTFRADDPALSFRSLRITRHPPRAWYLTLSPFRGAFVYCPALIAGLAGYAVAARRGRAVQATAALAVALFAAYMLLNLSLNPVVWAGSPSYFGPRYLLFGMPLAVLGAAHLDLGTRLGRLAAALGALSIAVNLLGAMFLDAMIRTHYSLPALFERPLGLLFDELLSHGPRAPLLDNYGVSRAFQAACLAAAVLAAAAALRRTLERAHGRDSML